ALANCTTGPGPASQPSAQVGIAETTSYSRIDTALRLLLAEPSPELQDLRPITLRALKAYYAGNEHAPLWIGSDGLTPRGAQLVRALLKARDAGAATLQPIMSAVEERRNATSLVARAEIEILLSGALLDAGVSASDPTVDAQADDALHVATSTNISDVLTERLPSDPAFWTLRDAILVYRDLAAGGGWPAVPTGPKLEPGTRDARIVAVRARLAAAGGLSGADVASDAYDETLRRAVERFQSRHGLAPDGVIGSGTLQALNVPIAMRIETMEANLRRLQRQSRDWGHTYIAVNIAAARYRLVRDGETIFEQVAIVGQPDWKTPEIDSRIERIELNPFWTVPPRIAQLEVGPEIEKDPDYLAKHNMRKVGEFYRQDPGPGNALGKAKFLFPNGYDVYLHDTNSPRLFEREVRFLSHGCVRIPNAIELAEHLLLDDPAWTRERIDAAIGRGKNRSIELSTPVPVHLVYDTAWVDESGEVQFRKDIYGRDADLLVAAAN
ncbi:MAG: L,D-transpeptidase family protein, partial [Dongiaceae bacterium]